MDIVNITQKAIVLDSEEIKKLKQIMGYAHHRANIHKKEQAGDLSFIKYFIKKLEEIK